jgi:hypothetical protein
MQHLDVLGDAFGVDDHGQHGKALYIFLGDVGGVAGDDVADEDRHTDLGAGVVDAVLVRGLMNLPNRGSCILRAKACGGKC